jgi:DNA replication protein DnaC
VEEASPKTIKGSSKTGQRNRLLDFKTFGDPRLELLVSECKLFILGCKEGRERIITFSGPTGIGKSYMSYLVKMEFKKFRLPQYNRRFGAPDVIHKDWNLLFDELNSNFSETIWKIKNCGLLIIEEFIGRPVSKHTGWTDLEIEKAKDVLNSRVGKATIIETNKSPSEIQAYDERIYSRLTRDNLGDGIHGVIIDLMGVPEYQDREQEELPW